MLVCRVFQPRFRRRSWSGIESRCGAISRKCGTRREFVSTRNGGSSFPVTLQMRSGTLCVDALNMIPSFLPPGIQHTSAESVLSHHPRRYTSFVVATHEIYIHTSDKSKDIWSCSASARGVYLAKGKPYTKQKNTRLNRSTEIWPCSDKRITSKKQATNEKQTLRTTVRRVGHAVPSV